MSWAHCKAVAHRSPAPSSAAVPLEIRLPSGEEPHCRSCVTGCGTMGESAAQPKDVMGETKGNSYPLITLGCFHFLSFFSFYFFHAVIICHGCVSQQYQPNSSSGPSLSPGRCPAFQVFNGSCIRNSQPWSLGDQPSAFSPDIFQCVTACVSRAMSFRVGCESDWEQSWSEQRGQAGTHTWGKCQPMWLGWSCVLQGLFHFSGWCLIWR